MRVIHDLKPYPAMKDSALPWVREIPTHWELIPNRAILRRRKILVGKRHSDYELLSLTKAGIVVRDISTGRGKFSADMGTSQEVRVGDLIFCLFDIPETPRTVGLSMHNGMITGAYTVFECCDHHLARFVEAFYIAMDDRKLLSPLYSGLRNTISPSTFLGIKTPIPPPSEQSAIVQFLDWANGRLERAIRTKRRNLALISEMLSVVTENALQLESTRRLRLSTVAEIMSRPINRCAEQSYTRIGLYNRGRGIFHKATTDGADLGDSDFFWVEDGDLVISGQFAWEGAVALARAKDSGCVASHRYPILRGREEYASSAVLFALFRTSYGSMLLDHHSRGAAGRNRPLNAARLLKEKVPIPPISAQALITELLAQEHAVAQSLAQTIQFINEYRTRLIADVVTGKLDVREAAVKLPDETEEPVALDEAEAMAENEEGKEGGFESEKMETGA